MPKENTQETIKNFCSAVIPCWNGKEYIKSCLDSLKEQTHKELEIIIVDNASTDGSKELIKENYPDAILIENKKNLGFSAAMNKGIKKATGEYILSLNLDATLKKDFIEQSIKTLKDNPDAGSLAGKVYLKNGQGNTDKFDTTGHALSLLRRAGNIRHGEKDQGQRDNRDFVFGVCAAVAMYKRQMLEDIKIDGEYFDEFYFTFFEDVDIDWRAQLRGWKCVYSPDSVAYHERGAFELIRPEHMQALEYRNWMINRIKNDTFITYLRSMPNLALNDLKNIFVALFKKRHLLEAYASIIKNLPAILKKRRKIQKRRKSTSSYMHGLLIFNGKDRKVFNSFVFCAFTAIFSAIFVRGNILGILLKLSIASITSFILMTIIVNLNFKNNRAEG